MPQVQGKITAIYASAEMPRFKISLGDREPQVVASEFWVSRSPVDPDGIPESPNYDALFALALWCASNQVRVTIDAVSLDIGNTSLTALHAILEG
jgi:hypothetical protein